MIAARRGLAGGLRDGAAADAEAAAENAGASSSPTWRSISAAAESTGGAGRRGAAGRELDAARDLGSAWIATACLSMALALHVESHFTLGTQDRQLHHGPQLQAFMKPAQDDVQSAQFVSGYGPATRLFQRALKQPSC